MLALGAFLSLVSAALFGFNNAATRRGVLAGTTIQGMAITVPMGIVLFGLAALAAGSLGAVTTFSMPALICFALAGFAHFVFGRYCNYRAIAAIGTVLASPIQQWEVLVTLALAVVFLRETLTPVAVFAILLLLVGPLVAARIEGKGGKPASPAGAAVAAPAGTAKFEPRYTEGYVFAFLSIFGYGSSAIFVRAGLENASIGDSMAAGLVSYVFATLVVAVWVLAGRQVEHVKSVERTAITWFLLAGLLVFLSQMFRYMALALVPVSVVAPIMRLQALFRIYFSWLITRDYEVFDRNVIAGTVIAMAGAILLSIQTEALLSWLPLPEAVKAVLRWRWP